jgi:glycine cleavage system regulatory protein
LSSAHNACNTNWIISKANNSTEFVAELFKRLDKPSTKSADLLQEALKELSAAIRHAREEIEQKNTDESNVAVELQIKGKRNMSNPRTKQLEEKRELLETIEKRLLTDEKFAQSALIISRTV